MPTTFLPSKTFNIVVFWSDDKKSAPSGFTLIYTFPYCGTVSVSPPHAKTSVIPDTVALIIDLKSLVVTALSWDWNDKGALNLILSEVSFSAPPEALDNVVTLKVETLDNPVWVSVNELAPFASGPCVVSYSTTIKDYQTIFQMNLYYLHLKNKLNLYLKHLIWNYIIDMSDMH